MTYNLKKCPRCGNKAEPVCDEERESIHKENVVECCKCALCTDGYATVEEAVQAWNKREIKGNSIDLGYEDWDGIDVTEFGKWISVKDRLPMSHISVLVTDKQGRVCVREYIKNSHWSQGKTDVTHWMPLPEPPERS